MQKFHPALWLWGITNTDDGYLLWSWADKWPLWGHTDWTGKKGRDCFGSKLFLVFNWPLLLCSLFLTTQTRPTLIARLRRYWNSWKGEFSGLWVSYIFGPSLNCSNFWSSHCFLAFFLLMFLEQKILRPLYWSKILGEKSNTTCHQKTNNVY